jgi:leucyl aminopeptidase
MKVFAGRSKDRPDAIFLFFEQGKKELSAPAREVDRLSHGGVSRVLEMGFKARRRDSELLVVPTGRWRLAVLLGLGEPSKLDAEALREAVAAGLGRVCKYKLKIVEVELIESRHGGLGGEESARATAEAFWYSSYQYKEFKAAENHFPSEVRLLGDASKIGKALQKAEVTGQEHCFVRDLVNKPGSELWPEKFAQIARRSARECKLKITVYDEKALVRMGYNGIASVGRGSERPPRLVVLRYQGAGPGKPLIGLVGKGVTFDTGGISLKPPEGMEKMKDDMSGAAAVLGAMRAAARLKLRLNLAAVIPLAENMPDGTAQRPGDILRMGNGTTVEVISTDAEGRLILADALHHCAKLRPKQIIDIATLTGACTIALGRFAIALMGNDEKLLAKISQAGLAAGERCWMLPLWDEYKELIRGSVSDLRNVGRGREAGTIIGGVFLKQFIGDSPWAHLDIAGTAWSDDTHPYLGRGPTGKGLRLLVRYLDELAKEGIF